MLHRVLREWNLYYVAVLTGVDLIVPIFFFQAKHHIISLLIDRCGDPDKRTRKFACFAVSFLSSYAVLSIWLVFSTFFFVKQSKDTFWWKEICLVE